MDFLNFLSASLVIYLITGWYIYRIGRNAFEENPEWLPFYKIIFIILFLSFPTATLLCTYFWNPFLETYIWLGGFCIGFLFYCLLGFLILNTSELIIRLSSGWLLVLEPLSENLRIYGPWTVWILSFCVSCFGIWNAQNPIVKELTFHAPKRISKEYKIVAVSDLHLGYFTNAKRVAHLVERVNHLHPDIILFLGDQTDSNIQHLARANLGEELKKLQAPRGIFAITGNHEYISGVDANCSYFEEYGIQMLRDEAIFIGQDLCIIGREDTLWKRYTNKDRLSIPAILENQKYENFYKIVLEHEPIGWIEASKTGVDLYLTGHTHDGQLWPLSFITRAIYGMNYGPAKIDNMHLFFSCGYGTAGPPMRVGNRPEILLIHIKPPAPKLKKKR